MRIHTDVIDALALLAAARIAGVNLDYTTHGSRKRDHAFGVTLTGSSHHRSQADRDNHAATWDEWGMFLGYLFRVDPNMTCWAYQDRNDFRFQTDWRFEEIEPTDFQRGHDHKWVVGVPYMQNCRKCKAIKRWRN